MLCIQSDLAVGLNDLTDQQGDNSSDAALDRTELQCDRNRREDSKGQRDACGDLARLPRKLTGSILNRSMMTCRPNSSATPYTAPITPERIKPFLVSGTRYR